MKKNILFFIIAGLFLFITACGDDDTPEETKGSLALEIQMTVGDASLSYGQTYTINGTAVSFDVAQFYMGGINVEIVDGDDIATSDYLLIKPGTTTADFNNVETDGARKIDFFVGVDAATNAQSEMDFTERPASDPLSIQDPSMHWNWATGYKFLRIDGMADTDGDGVPETPNAYHLGTDALLTNLSYTVNTSLESGKHTIRIDFDLEGFFSGVDLATNLDTHTGNNLPLAQQLRDNLPLAISVN